jgi:hypothetical protein
MDMECALFYPYTVPPTPWLKQSLLYYDVLGSIVQPSFVDAAPPDIAWLINRGVFEPVHIDDVDRQHADRLVEEVVEAVTSPSLPPPKLPRDQVAHVELNEGKLPRRIVQELKELGIIDVTPNQVVVEQQILVPLLCVMAKHAAAAFSVPGRTYSIHTTSRYASSLAFDPFTSFGSHAEVAIALRAVLPTPGVTVGFDDILEFKSAHRASLLRLRRAIETIASEIGNSAQDHRSTVNVLMESIEEERLRMRSAMRQRGWRAVSATAVAVATGFAGAHLAPGATPWVFSGVGSAVLSATVLAVRSGPMPRFSYVHDAEYLA